MSDALPFPARIAAVEEQAPDHRLISLALSRPMQVGPGQFVEIAIPGLGGFPVSAAGFGSGLRFEACIRRAGRVTTGLFNLAPGSLVGLRGPLGLGFPLEDFWGRDALLLAGGLGIAPLRGLLQALLVQRRRVGRIILLYGSRDPDLLLFRGELEGLALKGEIELRFSVDFAVEIPWTSDRIICRIGLVTELLSDLELAPLRTTAAVCGPSVLYDCVLEELAALGIPAARIFATLERRMKCGIGLCCHCVTGGVTVCRDGPVFSLERMRQLPGVIGGGL